MNRNFEEWLKTFRDSINDYDYYTDFAKVYEHAEKLKPEIYLLNSLVGAKNIERDFYASGGSKLNETARSYKMIAEESKNIAAFKFVWITDGKGWQSARKNLKETFLVLDTLYNIADLENGIFRELFNG